MKYLCIVLVVLLVALGLQANRHSIHFAESSESAHKREAADLLKSAMKEMGEGYDISQYRENHSGMVGPDARVIEYVKETGADPDAFADGWCNPFVQYQLKINGYEYSEYNRDSIIMNVLVKTESPVPGDVALFLGHIAFLYDTHKAFDGTSMADFLGGAQSGRVCIFSLPLNRVEFFARPIKAPKGWEPMVHPFWQSIENDQITIKRPTPHFAYPTPYPVQ